MSNSYVLRAGYLPSHRHLGPPVSRRRQFLPTRPARRCSTALTPPSASRDSSPLADPRPPPVPSDVASSGASSANPVWIPDPQFDQAGPPSAVAQGDVGCTQLATRCAVNPPTAAPGPKRPCSVVRRVRYVLSSLRGTCPSPVEEHQNLLGRWAGWSVVLACLPGACFSGGPFLAFLQHPACFWRLSHPHTHTHARARSVSPDTLTCQQSSNPPATLMMPEERTYSGLSCLRLGG
jgi:hypothetical protein